MNNKELSELLSSLRALQRARSEFLQNSVAKFAFSPNEAQILAALKKPLTASRLAKNTGVSKALISRSVKSLASKGLIEINVSSDDKREQLLTLTDSGREISRMIAEADAEFMNKLLRNIEAGPLQITQLTLKVMLMNLGIKVDDGKNK